MSAIFRAPTPTTEIYGVSIMDSEAARGEYEDTVLCTSLGDYLQQMLTNLGLPCCFKTDLWIPNSYDVSVRFKHPQALRHTDLVDAGWGQELDPGTHQYLFYLSPAQLKELRTDFNKHTPAANWETDCNNKDLLVALHLDGDF